MKSSDVDRLLTAIDAARAEIVEMRDASTHFCMGAFYGLQRAEQIVKAVDLDTPTCLIHCRQAREE